MGTAIADQDQQHLKLLSIFHYVLAGMMALFGCFPIIHLIVGITFLVAPDDMFPPDEPAPLRLMFGLMFTLLPAAFILFGWLTAGLIFYGGRCLAQRKRYNYCLFAAGVSCLFMPMGTLLGVFAIIVLVRPSVKALFDEQPPLEPKL